MQTSILVLYIITIFVIGFVVYSLFNKPRKIIIYNEMPLPSFPSDWWGYGWRPWWRKYGGVPGFQTPLPKPKIPKPSRSLIV